MTVIRADFGKARLNDSVKSEAFQSVMEPLANAHAYTSSGMSERRRYTRRTLDQLEKILIDRGADLKTAVYQLVHFINLAAHTSKTRRAIDVLFTLPQPLTPKAIRQPVNAMIEGNAGTEPTDEGILFSYGNRSFTIYYGRIPVLIALFEAMLSLPVDEQVLEHCDNALEAAEHCDQTQLALSEASNEAVRALDRALDEVFVARPPRERFGAVLDYLDANISEEADGPYWTIDDEAVLSFWEYSNSPDAPERRADFKRFQTAHLKFVYLACAIRAGEDWNLANQRGADISDMFTLHAEDTASGDHGMGSLKSVLDLFDNPPLDLVKFLIGGEHKNLEVIDKFWRRNQQFGLSCLRTAVMGGKQNDIETKRRFHKSYDLVVPRTDGSENPYDKQLAAWTGVHAHLSRMRMAAAHVVSAHHGASLDPEVQDLVEEYAEEAQRAFTKYNRKGFEGALEDEDLLEAFEMAIGLLSYLERLVADLLKNLNSISVQQFEKDAGRFETVFRRLYDEELA